jgi:hypothetical protein
MESLSAPEPIRPKRPDKAGDTSARKLLATAGLLMAVQLSLLLGLAYVVRSLKNVKLTLRLKLKRDDRGEKKY